jgi:hypothetical protein
MIVVHTGMKNITGIINIVQKLDHQLAPFATTSTMPITYHEIEERTSDALAHIPRISTRENLEDCA